MSKIVGSMAICSQDGNSYASLAGRIIGKEAGIDEPPSQSCRKRPPGDLGDELLSGSQEAVPNESELRKSW